ncbi:ATP-binding cassette domain-containing protein [Pontiellaceae bacterium B12227]|nr:ATP-binding cassette domain-containing protein [Pontiellaceae bacterium B12227]
MIEIQKVSKVFDGNGSGSPRQALGEVSMEFNRAQWCNLLGVNGSGKSTLLRIISGELQPSSGSISISGKEMTGTGSVKRAKHVFFVEQNAGANLVPTMTVEENVLLSLFDSAYPSLGFFKTRQRRSRVMEYLSELDMGLEKRLHTQVRFLSGGERQGLVLAAALASSTPILLLDEFLASTDPTVGPRLLNIAKNVAHREELTVISVTHNVDHVLIGNISKDRIVMLHDGGIHFDRKVDDLPSREWLVDQYKSMER